MSRSKIIARRIISEYFRTVKIADGEPGGLSDPSNLRYQAVFMMGTAGSGKTFVAENKYLKYMPGSGGGDVRTRERLEILFEQRLPEKERGLTNVSFEGAVERLTSQGFDISLEGVSGDGRIPFRLHSYEGGVQREIPREEWEDELPSDILEEVENIEDVIFSAPIHELPAYWRQVNPDVYKEELAGYLPKRPGLVHEMSSEMSKAYLVAALETGDPLLIDGTGKNVDKMTRQMEYAHDMGYATSLCWVYVPLAIALIRNSTRTRKVKPGVVANMHRKLPSNYATLRGVADKASFIENRNNDYDLKLWRNKGDKIDEFHRKETGLGYYDFVLKEAPNDIDILKKLGIGRI